MKDTSTIVPADNHLATVGRWLSERGAANQGSIRSPSILCFGDASSANHYCVTVPDVNLWNYPGDSDQPMRFVVFRASSQLTEVPRYFGCANQDWSVTSGFDWLRFDPVPLNDFVAPSAATIPEWIFESPVITTPVADPENALHHVVHEFALGVDGLKPAAGVIAVASRIVVSALERTTEPEFSVDDDGALSVDLRLSNGLRLLAELPIDGTLDVGVYDDRDANQRAREVEYLSSATAEELIALL